MNPILRTKSVGLWRVIGVLFAVFISIACVAQKSAPEASDLPGTVSTKLGPLAVDAPKDWTRVSGMGLAYFVPNGTDSSTAEAWIYISSVLIGPSREYVDLDSYIQYDVSAFKTKFPNAMVEREIPVVLPHTRQRARIYTFQSGDKNNSYEQVVYIGEKQRVLMFDLSAKSSNAFLQSMPVFREFVKSYRGSTNAGANAKKP